MSSVKRQFEHRLALKPNTLHIYTVTCLNAVNNMSVTTSPFLEMIRGEIRLRGYSIRTEKSYLFWIKQFILFHGNNTLPVWALMK